MLIILFLSFLWFSGLFDTFFELPKEKDIDHSSIYILDAYFDLISPKKIYSHTIYLVDIHYKDTEGELDEKEENYEHNGIINDLEEEYL